MQEVIKQKTPRSTVKAPEGLEPFGLSIPADIRRGPRFYDGGIRTLSIACTTPFDPTMSVMMTFESSSITSPPITKISTSAP